MSDTFHLLFPIQKIDREHRIVKGIATADNIDLADDVVSFDGSIEAFSNWIGNIREMHQPIAVGKLVDWNPVPIMHRGKTYNGIEVSVYISKGAEDTWQKILDGTLRGFSIGGATLEKERVFREDLQRSVNVIKRYVLGELSVVDNPCNPAGTFSMIKSVDGQLQYVAESNTVYYCATDDYASFDAEICPVCMRQMDGIGFSETLDEAIITKMIFDFKNAQEGESVMDLQINDKNDNVNDMSNVEFTEEQKETVMAKFTNFLFGRDSEVAAVATDATTAGGNVIVNFNSTTGFEMAKSVSLESTVEEAVEDTNEISKSVDGEEPSTEDLEKSIDEGEDEMDFEKAIEAIGSLLDEKLEKVKADITAEVDAKIEKSVSEVEAKSTEALAGVTEEIEKVANSGAVAKSVQIADEDEIETETIEKSATDSFWGGIFVPSEIAQTLGYDS